MRERHVPVSRKPHVSPGGCHTQVLLQRGNQLEHRHRFPVPEVEDAERGRAVLLAGSTGGAGLGGVQSRQAALNNILNEGEVTGHLRLKSEENEKKCKAKEGDRLRLMRDALLVVHVGLESSK